MKRFSNNRRNLEYIFHLFNLFATLLLFWHFSFFTIALKSFTHLYAISKSLFSNSFFVFLLLHVIILSIYKLSNQNDDVSTAVYNQCLKITSSSELVTADTDYQCFKITPEDPVESLPEKQKQDPVVSSFVTDRVESWLEAQQIFCNSEVGDSSLISEETVVEEHEPVMAVTETTTTTCCTTVTTTGDNKVSEEKCYRRVQSECYERSLVANNPRELRRFDTCLKKKEPQRSLCYVEELSKEEFKRTVDDFIAKHKRMMQSEERARSQKTEYLALTPY
ncbi:hypothetical protein MtrunA17_Chr3g0141791 [Medicago truncatula]|uniref:Transmembrane protein, putative n=1 Tax=Medicago truncatula TaxID=3880 RepID=A0A072V2U5_MEDTR|nr:transmembrane protein, putative [Medicago truncatula]RHN71025.1 hypothetical protein MtrunA17_Chr3g0141791 [Medicago truncatula]